jgi:hypothetical protein
VHGRLGDQARQLAHGSLKLGREPARTQLLEPAGERPVVPSHVFGHPTTSAPKLLSLVQVGPDERPRVVNLVGEGDQERAIGGCSQVVQVALLADSPRRPWPHIRIGALVDDLGNLVPEPRPDVGKAQATAVVLGSVVKEGADGLVLRPPGTEDQVGHRPQVVDVGPAIDPFDLTGVQLRRVCKRPVEPVAGPRVCGEIESQICGTPPQGRHPRTSVSELAEFLRKLGDLGNG